MHSISLLGGRRRRGLAGAVGTLALILLMATMPATAAADTAPVWTRDSPPSEAIVGYAWYYQFQASGDPAPTYSVVDGSLPPGMELDPVTGLVYGMPDAGDSDGTSYAFSIEASNSAGSVTVGGFGPGGLGTIVEFEPPSTSDDPSDCSTTLSNPGGGTVDYPNVLTGSASTVEESLPELTASSTEIVGRVLSGGSVQTVYDQTVPVGVSGSQAQADLQAAAAADLKASPGAQVASPALQSSVTEDSAPTVVSEVTAPAPQGSVWNTVYFGPASFALQDGPFGSCGNGTALTGQEAIVSGNYLAPPPVIEQLQETATTTSVYYVDATAATSTAATAAPTAKASADPAQTPYEWTLSAAGSAAPDGDALTYAWKLGATTIGTAPTLTYKFPKNGSYTVELTVTDAKTGLAADTSVLVTVDVGLVTTTDHLATNAYFDYNRAVLKPAGRRALKRLAATTAGSKRVAITGYAEPGHNAKTRAWSRTLSKARAQAVAKLLFPHGPPKTTKLTVAGAGGTLKFGKGKQIAKNRVVIVQYTQLGNLPTDSS